MLADVDDSSDNCPAEQDPEENTPRIRSPASNNNRTDTQAEIPGLIPYMPDMSRWWFGTDPYNTIFTIRF